MSTRKKGLTRRDFLRRSATATLIGAAGASALAQEPAPAPAAPEAPSRTRVVLVRDAAAVDDAREPNGEVLTRMFDEAIKALTGESDPKTAWATLIKPTDTVGIKTNRWRLLHVPESLEQAIQARVMAVGVPQDRIATEDFGVRGNPVFQQATALINTRPMRTHHWSGVGSCLKNYIPFAENPPEWHPDGCANLAGLWDLPAVKGKTRLNVLVMLTPLFHSMGAQHFNEEYIWGYKGLIVGTDPVAVDATGLRIIEAKRRAHFGSDQPFETSPKHIRVAQDKYGLGIADADRIDLVKLGWDEGILV